MIAIEYRERYAYRHAHLTADGAEAEALYRAEDGATRDARDALRRGEPVRELLDSEDAGSFAGILAAMGLWRLARELHSWAIEPLAQAIEVEAAAIQGRADRLRASEPVPNVGVEMAR